MAIAEIPIFEEALSLVQLSTRSPIGETKGVQLPLNPAKDEAGQVTQDELWLHYSTNSKISFERVLQEITKHLGNLKHPKPDEFPLFVLALARLIPPYRGSAVARLNAVLASGCDADVTLFYIVPHAFPSYLPFEIPPFRLGRLRSDKLKHRSEKAGSDYYERYRTEFRGAWAAERDPKPVRVLEMMSIRNSIFDTSPLGRQREPWEVDAWNATLEGYFSTQKSSSL